MPPGAVGRAVDSEHGAAPNHTGRIPVLEYHVIGGDKNALYTRTVASYKADLEDAYKRGYRPITIAQMLDKDFSDVPAGMSPVVFVFDDASPTASSATSSRTESSRSTRRAAMGIWLDFAKTHPGWKNQGDVLHAERRRGGPQLLRRQPEVRTARRRSGDSRR